ncbi:hypothetical protein OSCI_780013 [Kamptonema sp. PCC 6506]|nr:hypothetical protein OSCI_780013 [Kamptonema sp. PCC 6506]
MGWLAIEQKEMVVRSRLWESWVRSPASSIRIIMLKIDKFVKIRKRLFKAAS